MAELERLGCYTAVVDSMESGATVIDEMLRQKPTASDQDKLFLEMVNRTPVWKKGGVQ